MMRSGKKIGDYFQVFSSARRHHGKSFVPTVSQCLVLFYWTACSLPRLSSPFVLPSPCQTKSTRIVQRHTVPILTHGAFWSSTQEESTAVLRATDTRVGFIGYGTIAQAIATGLLTQNDMAITSVTVSRRSEAKSSALASAYPDIVSVCDDNQSVVDKSDMVFICLLPDQVEDVLSSITFDEQRHVLVSLASTNNIPDLVKFSGLPKDSVFKMICLPRVAKLQGVSLITPKDTKNWLKAACISLGGCIECEDENKMRKMMVASGLMGSMYGIMQQNRDWLVAQDIPVDDANLYIGNIYLGIVQDAEARSSEKNYLEDLVAEQTAGGLNEQALYNLKRQGALDAYDNVMNAILSRLEGKSDGYL